MDQASFETHTYALTVRDYARYGFQIYYRALLDVKIALLQAVATVSWAFLLKTLVFAQYEFTAIWPVFIVYPVFMLSVMPLISVVLVARSAKRTPTLTESGTASFTPDGFALRRGQLHAFLDWGAFKRVIETRSAIYLCRANETHIIPVSAFASTAMARAAAALARRNIKRAAGKTSKRITEMPQALPVTDEQVSPPFRLTFWMFVNLLVRNTTRGAGVVFLFIPPGIIAFAAWIYRADILDGYFDEFLLPVYITIVLITLFAVIILPLGWLFARMSQGVKGQRRVAISPDFIRHSGEGYDVQFLWKDLERVVRTRKYLVGYTRPRGFILVPASAFATRSEADAFFDQAKAWADAARAK